jgi:hypothetical protein
MAALEQSKVVYVDFLNGCYRSREGSDVVESGCWMDKWWSKTRLWQHKMNRCGEKVDGLCGMFNQLILNTVKKARLT